MSNRGGKRQGAGRPKGSGNKPNISEFLKKKDIEEFVTHILKAYKDKPELAKWLGDHIFGKAVQPIAGDEDNPLTVEHVVYLPRRREEPVAKKPTEEKPKKVKKKLPKRKKQTP